MAGAASLIYRLIFKRSPTLLLTAIVGGIFLERGVDVISDEIFHWYNKGLLWDDIKHQYETK